MKQVIMQSGLERLQGWIEDRGAKLGALVEVKGRGFFKVIEVFGFSLDEGEVKAKQDAARKSFTALKSYRGNK